MTIRRGSFFCLCSESYEQRQGRNQRGWVGKSPLPFFRKLEKSSLSCRKNACLWSSIGKISHWKWNFLRVSWQKTGDLLTTWPFFLVLYVNVFRSTLILRKLHCPRKNRGYASEWTPLARKMWSLVYFLLAILDIVVCSQTQTKTKGNEQAFFWRKYF